MSTPPTQLFARHDVVGNVQEVVESEHVPAHAPVPAQAAREPCGEPVTCVHVPTEPLTSQAWQSPAQASLQQTPSTQWPDAHAVSAPHEAPASLLTDESKPASALVSSPEPQPA